MAHSEVSIHELKVYLILKAAKGQWLTNAEIKGHLDGVGLRTVRAHTLKMVNAGLVERTEVFPSHKYRLADKRDGDYVKKLESARKVFGL